MVMSFYIGTFQRRVGIQKIGFSFDCFTISPKLRRRSSYSNLRLANFDSGIGSPGIIDLADGILPKVEDAPVRVFRWLAPLNTKLWLFVNFDILGTDYKSRDEEADGKSETCFDQYILG